MKLGPGSMGRPIQNLRMGQLGPGSKFKLIEIKLLTSELWTVRPIKQSFLKCHPVQLKRHSAWKAKIELYYTN